MSRVEASNFDSATVYVSFDNHRENDFKPYLYVSNDFGRTFRSVANNLPTGGVDFVHVVREDPYNRDLLFAGTDVGVYVSTNRGASWQKFMNGLPTVPVHDLKIHPRERELIAATHGRSIWIADIAPLEQMVDSAMGQRSYFFQPTQAYAYAHAVHPAVERKQVLVADNPPYGATFAYRLTSGDARGDSARIVITDVKGDVVRRLDGSRRSRRSSRYLGSARNTARARPFRNSRQHQCRCAGPEQRKMTRSCNRRSDTTGAGRDLPGMDTTAMRASCAIQ